MLALAFVLALGDVACGPKAPRPVHEGGASEARAGQDRVRSVVDPARPTLSLLHREGDPHGALAVAVFTTGGSRGALLLGRLMAHRLLANQRWPTDAQIHGIGFVLAAEVASPDDGARLLAAVRQALLEPVQPGEIASAHLITQLRDAARPDAGPSLTASCGVVFGAEGARGLAPERAPTLQELEQLRQSSVRSGRIGLSVLGKPALLERVTDEHHAKWPKGPAPSEAWPAEDQVAVRQSSGLFELEIALRLRDRGRALAAGTALRRADHALFTRLTAVDAELTPGPIAVALRPSGACLSLTLLREGPLAPTVETITAATLIAEREILRAVANAPPGDPTAAALLGPDSALEAASLAAWAAVAAPEAPARSQTARTMVEVLLPQTTKLVTSDLATLLQKTDAAWKTREIPLAARAESGQPESWLLLGSPCGTGPEADGEAGLRALSVESVARAWDGALSVTLEPWVEATAIGLLAHAAPLRGETPAELAERLARATVHALSMVDIDGRAVAAARSRQLSVIGSDPGHDLLLRSLSGGRPSTLDPRGLEREVAVLSTLDVQHARYALSREPLRAAYLASTEIGEAAAARAELGQLLAPQRSDVLPCPTTSPGAEAAGAWTITSVDSHVAPGAFVGIPVQTTSASGYALEFLLNRDGGYLERGLVSSGLAETARARFLPGVFGAALIVEVRAPRLERDRALAQVRGVLASLATGVPEADVELALEEDARRRGLARRGPRGRILELWLGEFPPPPTAQKLRALATQLAADQHRVVRVDVRAE